MEQPKDFEEIQTFEEFLDEGYTDLSLIGKITYHLQDHVWKAIFIGAAVGYLAGSYFGKFW